MIGALLATYATAGSSPVLHKTGLASRLTDLVVILSSALGTNSSFSGSGMIGGGHYRPRTLSQTFLGGGTLILRAISRLSVRVED